jgi:chromosome segregation ATPase
MIFISSGKIQTFSFIKNASNYLTKRKLVLDIKKGLHLIGIYSNELEEVKSSNKKLTNELEEVKSSNKKLTNELEEVKSSNKNLTNKIIGLEDENSGLKNNNKRLMNVALDLEKAVSNLEKDNAKLKNNISVLKNNISVLNKKVGDLQINNNKMEGEIKALKKDSIEKEKKIGEMNERLEQIDLRDTVKLSIRYLYKVFLSKFPSEVNFTEKIWEQIDEVKKILSKPEFKDFCFIPEFIDMITFDKLAHFNHIAHDSTKKKKKF